MKIIFGERRSKLRGIKVNMWKGKAEESKEESRVKANMIAKLQNFQVSVEDKWSTVGVNQKKEVDLNESLATLSMLERMTNKTKEDCAYWKKVSFLTTLFI